MSHALILVDLQNDFLPGGALGVTHGDKVIPIANRLAPLFDYVVATQDWHPHDHASFASQHPDHKVFDVIDLHGQKQVLWPDHCVQGSSGAAFAEALDASVVDAVFPKGENPQIDSYSGFFDNDHQHATGLEAWLREKHVDSVFVLGLAADFCVKFTALDAANLGFATHVVEDATYAVNAADLPAVAAAYAQAGVTLVESRHVPDLL